MLSMGYVSYTKLSQVAGSQLAVDGQVEQRQIPRFLRDLEPYPDGPDIFKSERGFLPD